MTDSQFRALIEASEVFKAFEKFKRDITVKHANIQRLKVYYEQAEKYGIDYLKQNPNVRVSEINLINSVLCGN